VELRDGEYYSKAAYILNVRPAKSEHPLAAAIVAEVKRGGLALFDCTDFQSISGKGASGLVGGRRISVGSIRYFETDARKFQRLLGLTGLVTAAQKAGLRGRRALRRTPLHAFDDAKVPFCAGSECLQCLFVIFALVGSQSSFVTFKFNNNSPLL